MVSTYGQWGFIPEILFVSDGGDVTRSQGWLNKMMIRWNSAPSIADWEKRIVTRLPKPVVVFHATSLIANFSPVV